LRENLDLDDSGEVFDFGEKTFLMSFEGTFRLSPDDILVMVTELDVVGGLCSKSLGLGLFIGKIVTLASVVGQNRFPILFSLTVGKLADFFFNFCGEELNFFLSVIKSSFLL